MKSLVENDRASAFRMVYLAPDIPKIERGALINKAELLEKELRKKLFGNQTKSYLDRDLGKNILFGIIVNYSNSFDLVIHSSVEITSSIKSRIFNTFSNL